MTQLPAMMQVSRIPARKRLPMVFSVVGALVFLVALAVAANLALLAAQEMSGTRMASASAASLIAALSLMFAIHSSRP